MGDIVFTNYNVQFLFNVIISILVGYVIGVERESRGKDAGISTNIFVISGSMMFCFMSFMVEGFNSEARIAAGIVTGIGFLGAGLILKEGERVINLTTAASLWFSAAVGMSIGFGYYVVALIATVTSVFVPRIPHLHKKSPESVHHDSSNHK